MKEEVPFFGKFLSCFYTARVVRWSNLVSTLNFGSARDTVGEIVTSWQAQRQIESVENLQKVNDVRGAEGSKRYLASY